MNDDHLEPGDPLLEATEALRRLTPIDPGLPERVARRRVRRQKQRRLIGGLAGGVLGAAAIALITMRPPASDGGDLAIAPVALQAGDERTFTLNDTGAHTIALVGDFTGWKTDSIALREGKDGRWEVTARIPPGRYRYAFVVDNTEWRADPGATLVPDDFGRPTSVLTVPSFDE